MDYGELSLDELERLAEEGDTGAQQALDAYSEEQAQRMRPLVARLAQPFAPSQHLIPQPRAEIVRIRLAPAVEEARQERDELRAVERARDRRSKWQWWAGFAVGVAGLVLAVLT